MYILFIQGVLLLLAPDWSVLTLPGAWLEAAAQVCHHQLQHQHHQLHKLQHHRHYHQQQQQHQAQALFKQVVFSLQLGLGALTTFASYNKYGHRLLIYFVVPIFVLSPHDIC